MLPVILPPAAIGHYAATSVGFIVGAFEMDRGRGKHFACGNLNFVAIYFFLGKNGVNHSTSIAAVDVRKPHALLPLSKQAS